MTDSTVKLREVPCAMKGVCCAERGRYTIDGVLVTPRTRFADQVWLTATDGRSAAIRTAEAEPGSDRRPPDVIPMELIPETDGFFSVERSDRWYVDRTWSRIDPEAARFPPVHEVLPSIKPGDEAVRVIALDADRLADLARAVCEPGERYVTLIVTDKPGPIVVLPYGPGGVGVMMPLMSCGPDDGPSPAERYAALRQEYIDDHEAPTTSSEPDPQQ